MQENIAVQTPKELDTGPLDGPVRAESKSSTWGSVFGKPKTTLAVTLILVAAVALTGGTALRRYVSGLALGQAEYQRNLAYFQDRVTDLERKVALLSDEVEARKDVYRRMIAILEDHGTDIPVTDRQDFVRFVYHEAMKNDLDPILAMAVIKVESSFETAVVSPMGAIGLMQVLPHVGRYKARELGMGWKGDKSLFDPYVNVRIGLAYLTELSNQFSSFSLALEAYNRGPGAVKDTLVSGIQPSTKFAQRVLGFYQRFQRF